MSKGTRPQHIGHFTPAYFADESMVGGGERYVNYLAKAIQSYAQTTGRKLSQTIIAFGSRRFEFRQDGVSVVVLENDASIRHPMSAMSNRSSEVMMRCDIVHIHQALTCFGAFHGLQAKGLGKIIVATDLGGGENPLMLQYGGLRLFDGCLSISEFAAKIVRPYFSGRHLVLKGPVDGAQFKRRSDSPKRTKEIVAVGRVLPHKGFETIIRALPQGHRLRVIGRHYDVDYLSFLKREAVNRDVVFEGDANDQRLKEIYATAGLFVHAATFFDYKKRFVSKPELLGLTTLEALASGLPAIVSNVASLPELAQGETFFRVFETQNDLERMLSDFAAGVWPHPSDYKKAALWAENAYGLEVVGQKATHFYEELLNAREARCG